MLCIETLQKIMCSPVNTAIFVKFKCKKNKKSKNWKDFSIKKLFIISKGYSPIWLLLY